MSYGQKAQEEYATMHYFTFDTKDGIAYAAVEDDEQAAKFEAAGWQRVDLAAFRAAWQTKDGGAHRPLVNPLEREVGK